ncbi:MAG: hypothetical protein K9N23_18915, partial [Akkermansiaceae bacterium]|nr:hypothetical protein [Akkermansiaceae bacterium]MCF7733768.1 hypothetical protein [Akkermansiaceae bacterium]
MDLPFRDSAGLGIGLSGPVVIVVRFPSESVTEISRGCQHFMLDIPALLGSLNSSAPLAIRCVNTRQNAQDSIDRDSASML